MANKNDEHRRDEGRRVWKKGEEGEAKAEIRKQTTQKMQKETCNKKNTRNKSKKRKHQEPPTTDVDCKEKQPTEITKRGGGREEGGRHTEDGGTREGEAG